jgi:hypothetical protein
MSLLGIRQKGTRHKELVATLTQQDLCDRCPAAGYAVILVKIPTQDPHGNILVFCRHHLNQHEPALAAQGATIYRKESE